MRRDAEAAGAAISMGVASFVSSRPGGALLVVAAVALAYSNAPAAGFQFDDFEVIVRDPRVQDLPAWWASMPGIRPLLKLSYALGHASGAGLIGFHVVNVLIHAANALLVLDLVGRRAAASGVARDEANRLGLATALLFALHPVQTEAVTYASGRSTSLSTAFALASLVLWARGRTRLVERADAVGRTAGAADDGGAEGGPGAKRGALAMRIGSPLLMALGLAVKESAVVVPAILLLWLATDAERPRRIGAMLSETAIHWAVLLVALAAGLALPGYQRFVATSLATRTPFENAIAQVHGVAWLLGQILRIDQLNADPALAARTSWEAAGPVGAGLLVAFGALVVGAAIGLKRRPLAGFAVLWTAVWLAPTNSLLARLDLVNERQLYGALVGPMLLVALAFAALDRSERHAPRVAARVALVALLVVLGVATHRRNDVYRDEVVFWRDVIAKSPANARAWNNLGIALAERCDAAGAERAWREALARDPGFVRAAVNLRLLREGHAFDERCRSAGDRPGRRSDRDGGDGDGVEKRREADPRARSSPGRRRRSSPRRSAPSSRASARSSSTGRPCRTRRSPASP